MRVLMVGDCASVGYELAKAMRMRGHSVDLISFDHGSKLRYLKALWVLLKVRFGRWDLVHAHYLRFPAYCALLSGKPFVIHCHGSDLRIGNLGWLKRRCLSKAKKVLVSTPDLLRFVPWAVYVPNPVDMGVFSPKPLVAHSRRLRVLVASCAWVAKGSNMIVRALAELSDRVEVSMIAYGVDFAEMLALAGSLNLQINTLDRVSHDSVREYYWNADLILDQFRCGVVGNVFLEAVACGRPAIGFVSSAYPEYEGLPLKDVDSYEKLVKAIADLEDLAGLWEKQYAYVKREHDGNMVVEKVLKLYGESCCAV